MSAHDLFASALPALAAVVALGVTAEARADDATRLRSDLHSLAKRSVLFGHQSVGMNVLDGVSRLAAREGVILKVVDVTNTPGISSGAVSHAFEPENGKPEMKLQSFARRIQDLSATPPDLALLKFCYVDFDARTDAAALFARYQATLADLRRRSPGITFVHVTAPLTTVQGGAKAFLKRLSGGTPYGLVENARRDDYNQLVRKAYRGREPLFDLAEIESSPPDGGRETVDWKGRAVPALVVDYASDDGHLNEAGQERAAGALLAVLAAARP